MAELIRGDSAYFRIPFKHPISGDPYDISGCDVWVTMKKTAADPDNEAIYMQTMQIDSEGEVTASDGLSLESTAAAGVVIQRISPEMSKDFDVGSYVVDVQIHDTNSDVWTPVLGVTETVVIDITHAIEMV